MVWGSPFYTPVVSKADPAKDQTKPMPDRCKPTQPSQAHSERLVGTREHSVLKWVRRGAKMVEDGAQGGRCAIPAGAGVARFHCPFLGPTVP